AGEWWSSPDRALDAGHHEDLALGAPYDTDVTWRVVAVDALGTGSTADAVIHTDVLPEGAPVAELVGSDPTAYDPATPWVVVSVTGDGDWTEIVDRRGRVVWALVAGTDRATLYPQLSLEGDSLLIDHNTAFTLFDEGAASEVVELTIDGTVVRSWATPGAHHPFAHLPGDEIAYARSYDTFAHEDLTVVAADGSTRQVFDCDAWAAEIGLVDTWCSANALKRDPVTGNLLYTLFTLQSTIEVDPVTASAVRWFGDVPGAYAFDAPSSGFVYPHGGYFTDAGTFLISDSVAEPPAEMLVREYAVDAASETLTEIWQFGLGEGIEGFGFGDVYRLPGGNTHQNCGFSRLREATPDGRLVWDVKFRWSDYPVFQIGRSTPFADLYALAPTLP
ncbi:MAG: hypothetical protein ABMB14_11495, partial [Myxococcota bacterium]